MSSATSDVEGDDAENSVMVGDQDASMDSAGGEGLFDGPDDIGSENEVGSRRRPAGPRNSFPSDVSPISRRSCVPELSGPLNSTEVPSNNSILQALFENDGFDADGPTEDSAESPPETDIIASGMATRASAATEGSDDEGESVAAQALRRLAHSRIVRYDIGTRSPARAAPASEAPGEGDGIDYMTCKERIHRLRRVQMELEKKADRAIDDVDTQNEIVIVMENIANREVRGCRTAEEFMAISRLTEIPGRILRGMFSSALCQFGGALSPKDVAKAVAEDPKAALRKMIAVKRAFRAAGMTRIQMLHGRRAACVVPNQLSLDAPPEAPPEKKKREKREKEKKVVVVPQRADEEEDNGRHTDPTALGVMRMHEKLRVAKKLSLFELVRDPDNDVEKSALNSHILAILLDRQLARMVTPEDAREARKHGPMVYFVAKKAADNDPRARKKLAEDVAQGHTWITRWDVKLLKIIEENFTDVQPRDRAGVGVDGAGTTVQEQATGGGTSAGDVQRSSAPGPPGLSSILLPVDHATGPSGLRPNSPPMGNASGLGVPGPSGCKPPRAKRSRRK